MHSEFVVSSEDEFNLSKAELSIRNHCNKTFVSHQYMPHPFHMTVPFTVPGDPENFLTLYLQSSSGGLYDNDEHELNVDLSKKSNFHLTTQASTIVHEAKRNKGCKQNITFKIKEDSYLEYLPDPIILMAGSKYSGAINVEIEKNARAVFCDSYVIHDPRGNNEFFVDCFNETRVFYDKKLVFDDKYYVLGKDYLSRNGNYKCSGTVYIFGVSEELLDILQDQLSDFGKCYFGCSIVAEKNIVIRLLADDAIILTNAINSIWESTRKCITGLKPNRRRK